MNGAEIVTAIVCLASLVVFALSLRAVDLLASENERLRKLIAALERGDVIDIDTVRRRG